MKAQLPEVSMVELTCKPHNLAAAAVALVFIAAAGVGSASVPPASTASTDTGSASVPPASTASADTGSVTVTAPQDGPASTEEIVGTYTVDVPDYGLITIQVRHREEDDALLISASEQPETVLKHVEDNRYEIDTDMYGIILIEFRQDDEGKVTSMTLDSYEFSLLAEKKTSQ